ncbi:MAG: hypothetical protein V2I97_17120 [Desulfococcaceae bacterium]|jgi:hypothetical protein|nr:hypothetical protein [Desulfococcaceae bacterium]
MENYFKKSKREKLLPDICEGALPRFNKEVCPYYESLSRDCALLKKDTTEEYWDKCRYAFELFYQAVEMQMIYFKKNYQGLPIDDAEDFDFEGLIRRLRQQKPDTGHHLAVWAGYIRKSVYLEIKNRLAGKGLIPREKKCGSCAWLSLHHPRICGMDGKQKKKSDNVCEKYKAGISRFVFIDAEREEGKNAVLSEISMQSSDKTPENKEKGSVAGIRELLKKRAAEQKKGSARWKKYHRQYEVFVTLRHSFAEGISKREVMAEMRDRYGLDQKTIRRDITEIREFLQNKNVR